MKTKRGTDLMDLFRRTKRYNATADWTHHHRPCVAPVVVSAAGPFLRHHQQQSAARGRPFFQSSAARRGRRPLQSSTSSTSTCWPAGLVSWGIWIMEYVSRPGLGPHTYHARFGIEKSQWRWSTRTVRTPIHAIVPPL